MSETHGETSQRQRLGESNSATKMLWTSIRNGSQFVSATQVMIDMSDPRSDYFDQMRHETLPPDHLFGRRMEMLTLAVLSQLRVRGNFHQIAREWLYGDAPVTPLGEEEAAFYARAAA